MSVGHCVSRRQDVIAVSERRARGRKWFFEMLHHIVHGQWRRLSMLQLMLMLVSLIQHVAIDRAVSSLTSVRKAEWNAGVV